MSVFFLYFLLFGVVGTTIEIDFFGSTCVTPKYIYDKCHTNWFGTLILFILLCVFSPALALLKLINWLFTVGRKEGKDE